MSPFFGIVISEDDGFRPYQVNIHAKTLKLSYRVICPGGGLLNFFFP